METLEVRPALDADLPEVVAALGQREFFVERLERQRAGNEALLVAWVDGRPVGDVVVSWIPVEAEVREHLPGVPQLYHLEVLSTMWRRGIGTALLRAAEEIARGLGYDRVTLSVGLDNPAARRLYERLGYADWGHGHAVTAWQEPGPAGIPVTVQLTCDVLVKTL